MVTSNLIGRIWDLIKSIFRRRAPVEPTPHVDKALDKKLAKQIQKRQAREGRPVDTCEGGPNMPKSQPCTCGLLCKRTQKTMGGARYNCRIHGEFFVRTPGL